MKRIFIFIVGLLLLAAEPTFAQKKQTSDFNYRKAEELYDKQGDPDEILSLLNKQLAETPEHCDALIMRSLIYIYQEKVSSALSDITRAITKYNKKTTTRPIGALYLWRAEIYHTELEDNDKALADMQTAYKYLKKDHDLLRSLLSDRAQIYYERKEYDKADDDYRQLLKMDESSQYAMIGLARNMLAREEYDIALEMLNNCAKYDAKYVAIYQFRCQVYDKLGETDKAIDDAIKYIEYKDEPNESLYEPIFKKHLTYALAKVNEKVNKEKDNWEWLMLRTTIYEWANDYVSAIAEYDKLEQEYGSRPNILYYRAACYNEIGENEKAVADMTKCIEMRNGKDYYAVVNRGDYYREDGRYEEAIADFTYGMELRPTSAYPYYKRGWCYELIGDDDKAMADYNAGIDIDKSYPYIFLMRGELHLKRGNNEMAKVDFEEVIKQDTIATAGSCRQYALHFLDKDDEAIEWMEKIIADEPARNGGYYDKSCLLSRMGRLEEAVEALRKAFELGYRSFAHIEHDDDMDPIRDMPEFKSLIEEYRNKPILVSSDDTPEDETSIIVSEIQMKKMYGGTYEVPCTINELPLKFIFDTGASTVSISSVEASFMLKNEYLKPEDVKGKEYYSTATGEIHEGTTIRLREIKIGDVVLRNVDASVVHNQKAPLLLGQSVLERFGTITIDNINSKLIIKQK